MSDLRDKQPDRIEGLAHFNIMGGDTYAVEFIAWTYSSIKNEDVFPRSSSITIQADSFDQAYQVGKAVCKIISQIHDIHKCRIVGITS